ncbi:MAG TPA: DHH family phosphoesterase [Defluviitaleaceae bacterium]|mgnify:CR=1 FL=1|nr:DHH family phosphoesterase [Defluviitaleaceae bacterium]
MDNSSNGSFFKRVFLLPQFYIVILYLFAVVLLLLNYVFGLVSTAICILISILFYRYGKKEEIKEVAIPNKGIAEIYKNSLSHFPIPFAMVDIHGWIQWYNSKFEAIIKEKTIVNKNISDIFPDINFEIFPESSQDTSKDIKFEDKNYKVTIYKINQKEEFNNNLYGIYFVDDTENYLLREESLKQKISVGIILIDNYEEVMQSIEDVRKPLLLALIDRKINVWVDEVKGIVKKIDRDQYFVLFYSKHLDLFKKKKFEILDEIREINIGNELPVTLSIGVGVNGKNLPQSMEYAKAAIDLALGRGGDQAVIKNEDKYYFYGGKTKEVEKSTRVKARMKAYAFRELMEETDEVIIMGHKNPDVDCLGSAIGVYRCAQLLGKKAHIVLNETNFAIKGAYDKLIESEEYDDKLFLNSIEALASVKDTSLLVVVDVHRPSYTECPELLELSKKIVVFDHHRRSEEFIENAVLTYLEPFISSTCEMITEILQYIVDKVKLTPIEADILLAGITIDTKNFVFKTGVRTFEAAAFLKRNGADSTRVRMLFQNDMEAYKAKAEAVRNAEIYKSNIAISVAPSNVDNIAVIAAQAADELLSISGIKASFVMCELGNEIIISARSLGDINVQIIMEKLGGGGHLTVAGAQLKESSLEDVLQELKYTIDDYLEEGD